jgi:aminoglycoside 3'-phosphotransferase-2
MRAKPAMPTPPPLPTPVTRMIAGYAAAPVGIGLSSASVFRLTAAGKPPLILKCAEAFDDVDLEDEAGRLRWFKDRASVPAPLACGATQEIQYLLMTAVAGTDAAEPAHHDRAELVRQLAAALRELHARPIDACPFDQRLEAQIARARRSVIAGTVDESDFDDERDGWSAGDVLTAVLRTRPDDEDLVLTHGDACLPNVMFDGGHFTGFVDLGRAGVADRYQDLALAARSIYFNLGEDWVDPFFIAYGLRKPDAAKLAFYRLLDELF